MRRIKLLIFLGLCLIAIPNVYAQTASTRITGSNSIKVGNTTTLYVNVDSSSTIKGVDVTYSSSGSISVVSVSAAGGMAEQSRNGNRILLYSSGGVSSGSSVLAITVKGNSVGTGTVSVTRLEATVGGETAVSNSATFTITVNPAKTQAEIDAENARAKAQREADAKAKEEAEKKAKEEEEARKLALSKATLLVEAAEKSQSKDDYEEALEAVKALVDSDDKTALLKRLEEVRFYMAVKDTCTPCEIETKCDIASEDQSNKWLILNVALLLVVIGEFIYIIVSRKKEKNEF